MVELNEKALKAACRAWINSDSPMESGIRDAVRAYLSALPEEVMFCPNCGWNSAMDGNALPAPDDGLVGRLRYRVENPSAWDTFDQGGSDLIAEAAIALQSQAEQIERLTQDRDSLQSALEGVRTNRDGLLESAEQQVQKLTAENERLREIVSKCAAALPNGAHINPKASLDFMAKLPAEIRSVCSALETQEGGE